MMFEETSIPDTNTEAPYEQVQVLAELQQLRLSHQTPNSLYQDAGGSELSPPSPTDLEIES